MQAHSAPRAQSCAQHTALKLASTCIHQCLLQITLQRQSPTHTHTHTHATCRLAQFACTAQLISDTTRTHIFYACWCKFLPQILTCAVSDQQLWPSNSCTTQHTPHTSAHHNHTHQACSTRQSKQHHAEFMHRSKLTFAICSCAGERHAGPAGGKERSSQVTQSNTNAGCLVQGLIMQGSSPAAYSHMAPDHRISGRPERKNLDRPTTQSNAILWLALWHGSNWAVGVRGWTFACGSCNAQKFHSRTRAARWSLGHADPGCTFWPSFEHANSFSSAVSTHHRDRGGHQLH